LTPDIRCKSQSVRRVGADAPHYVCALSIYHKAVLSAVDLADSLKYNDALKLKEKAFRMLASARGDYWNHVSMHGCSSSGNVMVIRPVPSFRIHSQVGPRLCSQFRMAGKFVVKLSERPWAMPRRLPDGMAFERDPMNQQSLSSLLTRLMMELGVFPSAST
jgi:hypothetical protein